VVRLRVGLRVSHDAGRGASWHAPKERRHSKGGGKCKSNDQRPPFPGSDRFLGTVLFADVVGSTRLAAEIGDSRFRDLIEDFHQLVRS